MSPLRLRAGGGICQNSEGDPQAHPHPALLLRGPCSLPHLPPPGELEPRPGMFRPGEHPDVLDAGFFRPQPQLPSSLLTGTPVSLLGPRKGTVGRLPTDRLSFPQWDNLHIQETGASAGCFPCQGGDEGTASVSRALPRSGLYPGVCGAELSSRVGGGRQTSSSEAGLGRVVNCEGAPAPWETRGRFRRLHPAGATQEPWKFPG